MVVTVVTVAAVSGTHTWVAQVLGAHRVASIGWQHESLHEVVVEEVRQLGLTMPSVESQHLLLELLLHRWYVIINLEHDISALVVEWFRKDLVFWRFFQSILLCHTFVLEADSGVRVPLRGIFVLVIILSTADEEQFTAIERIRLQQALILLSFRADKRVKELPVEL